LNKNIEKHTEKNLNKKAFSRKKNSKTQMQLTK